MHLKCSSYPDRFEGLSFAGAGLLLLYSSHAWRRVIENSMSIQTSSAGTEGGSYEKPGCGPPTTYRAFLKSVKCPDFSPLPYAGGRI